LYEASTCLLYEASTCLLFACRQPALNIVELREYMDCAELLQVDLSNNLFGDAGAHVRASYQAGI
jgi:hypothetical protein